MRRAAGHYAVPLAVYLLSRVVTTVFILVAAPRRAVRMEDLPGYHSAVTARLPAHYGSVVTSWDGQWYWDIVLHGYPSTVVDTSGHAVQSSLAFFPLYPALVRAGMAVTGLGFEVVAPTLSLLLGAAAVLVVFRLVERRLDTRRATGAVLLLCCFVSSPILQTAYTESLALLLVAVALLLLTERRYGWAIVPVLLLGLTRNIALVLLPVVLVHWLVREHEDRRGTGSGTPRVRLAVLAAAVVGATGLWPALAGLLSGHPDAYFTTIQAWPGFTGSALRPPWAAALTDAGVTAWLAAGLLLALLALALLSRPVRRWGPELWAWTASLVGFVVLTTSASTSILRYLLLAFPLGLVLMPDSESAPTRRLQHVVVAAACLLGLAAQFVWVDKILVYAGPTGGWGFP